MTMFCSDFGKVCEQSTDFHFPTLEQQFETIEVSVQQGIEDRAKQKHGDSDSGSVKSSASMGSLDVSVLENFEFCLTISTQQASRQGWFTFKTEVTKMIEYLASVLKNLHAHNIYYKYILCGFFKAVLYVRHFCSTSVQNKSKDVIIQKLPLMLPQIGVT